MTTEQQEQNVPQTFKVFVGNLAFATSDESLKEFFSKVGEVVAAHVITRGNRSLGYGFVDFTTLDLAEKAVKDLSKQSLDGREINVELAKPRENPPADRGNNQGGQRRGGYRGGFRGGFGGQGGYRGGFRGGRGGFRGQGGYRGGRGGRGGYRGEYRGERGDQQQGGQQQGGQQQGGDSQESHNKEDHQGGQQQQYEGGDGDRRGRGGFRGGRGGFRGGRGGFRGGRGGFRGGRGGFRGGRGGYNNRRPPRDENQTPSATTLFVANLPYEMDEQALMNLFSEFKPKQARIARLRGRSKGFGFVELETQELQKKAAEALDGKEHNGRVLNVKIAVVDLSAPPAENQEAQQQQ